MTDTRKKILTEVLKLSPIERAELVENVLSSFDLPAKKINEELWAKEAEDRIDAYERGEMKSIPAEKVFKKINNK